MVEGSFSGEHCGEQGEEARWAKVGHWSGDKRIAGNAMPCDTYRPATFPLRASLNVFAVAGSQHATRYNMLIYRWEQKKISEFNSVSMSFLLMRSFNSFASSKNRTKISHSDVYLIEEFR